MLHKDRNPQHVSSGSSFFSSYALLPLKEQAYVLLNINPLEVCVWGGGCLCDLYGLTPQGFMYNLFYVICFLKKHSGQFGLFSPYTPSVLIQCIGPDEAPESRYTFLLPILGTFSCLSFFFFFIFPFCHPVSSNVNVTHSYFYHLPPPDTTWALSESRNFSACV